MYHIVKRVLDIIFSFIFLILLVPLFLLVGIYNKIKYKKIIFRQKRSGIYNSVFIMYKFVTMKNNQISLISKLIRKLGIDEIPQLWNILKGDMSFVGPRPWITEFNKYFTIEQSERLKIKPGLTGYSQIIHDDDIFQRIDRDIFYVKHYNFLWDVKIFVKTFYYILFQKKDGINNIEQDIELLKNQKQNVICQYSVLLPVCIMDNPMWLKKSIESVLNQTYKTNDFIIIADGKLNKSLLKTIYKYKNVRFIQNQKVGLSEVLNKAIDLSRNDWIARIDADDFWEKEKMERQLLFLENHKQVVLLGTNMQEFTGRRKLRCTNVPINHDQVKKYAKYRNPFRHSSVVFRKDVIETIGKYRNIEKFEDYDLWLRVINDYQTHNLEECLVNYRVDNHFYERRGGVDYFHNMVLFEKIQFKEHRINYLSYIIDIVFHGIVCLVPSFLRKIIYEKVLRR